MGPLQHLVSQYHALDSDVKQFCQLNTWSLFEAVLGLDEVGQLFDSFLVQITVLLEASDAGW